MSRFFSSLTELLQSGISIDVVNVCTPNGLHAAMAIQAVETGCNVVIEKPMALTLADAEKVVYASLKYRKQVFCVMQNRYSPPSVWIKEMVDSGRLGKIYMVQLNCYWNRDERYYKPGGWHGDAALDGGRSSPSSPILSTLCTGFSGISAISRLALPISTMPDLRLFEDSGFVNFNFVNGGMGEPELFHFCLEQEHGKQYADCCRERQRENRRTVYERSRILPYQGL